MHCVSLVSMEARNASQKHKSSKVLMTQMVKLIWLSIFIVVVVFIMWDVESEGPVLTTLVDMEKE